MISAGGWQRYCIWEHSASVRDLYERRCRGEAEEMTAHRQAVALLQPHVAQGDTLLDAGCGSGYFFHALRRRQVPVDYFGIDGAPSLLAIGRRILPDHGLEPTHLMDIRIEDMEARVDHVVCINVLSNIDNFHRPLERLLHAAGKTLILRESIAETASYAYVRDRYLDEGVDLNVHVNTYARADVAEFIRARGFDVEFHVDDYTGGQPQDVIGHTHYWTFVRAIRKAS